MVQLSDNFNKCDCTKSRSHNDASHSLAHINKYVNIPGLLPNEIELDVQRPTYLKLYWHYIKTQFKTILSYVLITILLTIIFIKYVKWVQSSWFELSNNTYDLEKSDSSYLQAYNPDIYEKILKELQYIQRATAYIQKKQTHLEKKNLALHYQFKNIATNSYGKEILNEAKTRALIQNALETYDADKLGLRDYALESAGGCIESIPSTTPYLSETQYIIFGFISYRKSSNPRLLIQPDIHPGKCFAFEGSKGRIRIKLANTIHVSAVTLDHAPISLLTEEDIQSAPRDFELLGLADRNDNHGYSLGSFRYIIDGTSIQTFLISYPINSIPIQYIELIIHNNYGHKHYTCVYRVRIHGKRIQ